MLRAIWWGVVVTFAMVASFGSLVVAVVYAVHWSAGTESVMWAAMGPGLWVFLVIGYVELFILVWGLAYALGAAGRQ